MAETKLNRETNNSTSDITQSRSVTRKPLIIFKKLETAKNVEDKQKHYKFLNELKDNFPESLNIAAAVGNADSFFDSLAQALNELNDKGLIGVEGGFNVQSLRKICKKYAEQSQKDSWLDTVLKNEGEKLSKYVKRIGLTAEDVKSETIGTGIDAIQGRPEIEGRIICEQYGVKLRTIELRYEENGYSIAKVKVGKGKKIIYVANYKTHFVPLLSYIEEDFHSKIKVSRDEVYGYSSDKRKYDFDSLEFEKPSKRVRLDSKFSDKSLEFAEILKDESEQEDLSSLPVFGEHEIISNSPKDGILTNFLIRRPLFLFRRLKNAKNDEKIGLGKFFEKLQEKLPEGFKMAAAVSKEDSFFDSLAQALNELQEYSLIEVNERFSVKSLRKNCVQHADQCQEDSWLVQALGDVGENLFEYKQRIGLTAEDANTVNAYTEIGEAIWGRLEIEGKIICEQYGVKIICLELKDEELIGFSIKKLKVGRGKNVVYVVSYKKHFVPVLRNIEMDITDKIKVCREEVYGVKSKSRKRSFNEENDRVVKRMCKVDVSSNANLNEVLEFSNNLESSSSKFELSGLFQRVIPHQFIKLMYQLDLSVLCLFRKHLLEDQYPYLAFEFKVTKKDKFDDIILRYKKNKSIYIQIEYLDNYYLDENINYSKLFTTASKSFSLNYLFQKFKIKVCSKLNGSFDNIKYLVIYTNVGLEMTEKNELKTGKFKDFYPFKFEKVEECRILNKFLLTYNNAKDCGFYQFSKDEITRKELLKRLKFSNTAQKELKVQFLNKLVFAVKQPNREELNLFLQNKIYQNKRVHDDHYEVNYTALQEEALAKLTASKEEVPELILEFNLLMSFLNEMFLNKDITSINYESHNFNNDTVVSCQDKKFYIKAHHTCKKIGFNQLFPTKKYGFSLNNCFLIFLEKYTKCENIVFFIIYTNGGLDLTKENELKKVRSKVYCPLRFCSIDLQTEVYKHIKGYTFINENDFYQFSNKDRKTLLNLLKLPEKYGHLKEDIMKNKFLDSLLFAVNQPEKGVLNYTKGLREFCVPYNNEELQEIALRWLESHDFDVINKNIIENLLEDIKNKRVSYQMIRQNIDQEIRFARAVGGRNYRNFLDFCIKGEGKRYLEILRKEKINRTIVSSILGKAGAKSEIAFKSLFELWFDQEGNKRRHLKTLEKEAIDLRCFSGILGGSGANAASAFKSLYELWFDKDGNKSHYLKILERSNISLSKISSLLHGTNIRACTVFMELFNMWFDQNGNKTKYLKTLSENNINFAGVSGIIGGSGAHVAKSFKDLFELWFDENGNKTQYLKTLDRHEINLNNLTGILHGTGPNATTAFMDLYNLWFDIDGDKSLYLKNLEKCGISITNITSILTSVGIDASKNFKDLYKLWFDEDGNKTLYLKTLEKAGINPSNISNTLHATGRNVVLVFKSFFNLLFDSNGKKTQCFQTLERNGIGLSNISSILMKSGLSIATAFKNLYDLWFDSEGNKTQYLRNLEREEVTLKNMTSILIGAGVSAATVFKNLHDVFFDQEGNQTQYLRNLKKENINFSSISSILNGTGPNAVQVFKELHELWFDKEGNKTHYLENIKKSGIKLVNISSILNGAGANAPNAFLKLYKLWFDEEGNKTQYLEILERNDMNLSNISGILHGTGTNGANAFKELFNTFFDAQGNLNEQLKHFYNADNSQSFRLSSISGILNKTGTKAKLAFENLHSTCFDTEGKSSKLLDDFYEVGFTPSNISAALFGAGVHASSMLKHLHSVCFNKQGEATNILTDFFYVGFSPGNLCSMLSGASKRLPNSLKSFHKFCFKADTKIFLNNFLSEAEDFTPSRLSKILHGAGINICAAFKSFHDVCYDKDGNESALLIDFRSVGFTFSDLTSVLSMSGNRAANIFQDFHKVCFNSNHYFEHFLNESEFFTPKKLAQIFHGVGISVYFTFEKLHDLCFDKNGEKSKYLNKLIRKDPKNLVKTLNEIIKKDSST